MKLRIQKLHPNARVPEYSTEGAACFDLYAATVSGMGEVMVMLESSRGAAYISPGDRIAQVSLVPAPRVVFEVCEQLTLSDRGGFGSAGA